MRSQIRSRQIRDYLIAHVPENRRGLARSAAEHFGVTPQAINKHLRALVAEGVIRSAGATNSRRYELVADVVQRDYGLAERPQEDVVWRDVVEPLIKHAPPNVGDICHYGFTEMVNNAIDHSEGSSFSVAILRSAKLIELTVQDDGVGIFRKISRALTLPSEHDAVLELAKGKFTTDPRRHTGEGIFFSSRMFDAFSITSRQLTFSHIPGDRDWLVEESPEHEGTLVRMSIDLHSSRTSREVFDRFAVPDEYAFLITHVPVALARHGDENLVSRSQGRRLVRGFDRFEEVLLDFTDVGQIGQAFADEVFRVFQLDHPKIVLRWANASPDVERMIKRARAQLRG